MDATFYLCKWRLNGFWKQRKTCSNAPCTPVNGYNNTIKVTVGVEGSFWTAVFERVDDTGLSAARVIFGKEPTDPELYEWISENYLELKFSKPQDFKLVIKRKNPKRVQREVRREVERAKSQTKVKESYAQEVLRLELEKNKKISKQKSRADKELEKEKRFAQKQAKKKKKQRGH
ncbi:MAG: YjdF family protein [Deltaproteobacteria bacterium]|nr:YjdF family protein [Deltaproteobacteria bacterium]